MPPPGWPAHDKPAPVPKQRLHRPQSCKGPRTSTHAHSRHARKEFAEVKEPEVKAPESPSGWGFDAILGDGTTGIDGADFDDDAAIPRLRPFPQREVQSAKVRGSRDSSGGAGRSRDGLPRTNMNAFAKRAAHLVKSQPSGIDLRGEAPEFDASLLRTHELEIERLTETTEVLHEGGRLMFMPPCLFCMDRH